MTDTFLKQGEIISFIGRTDLTEALKRYETPFFLYSGESIINRYNFIKQFIKWKNIKIFYAMKSNYHPQILEILRNEGCGIDAVSPAEVFLALKCGFTPDRVIFTSNNSTDEEISEISRTGVLINIDSLSRLEKYGRKYQGTDICLRFNTDVVAGEHSHIQTGGPKTKFGILLSDVEKVLQICGKYSLKVIGVHKHAGSGISDKSKFIQSMKNLLSIALKENFPDLKFIDLGGGFKVKYHPEEADVDYDEFGETAGNVFKEFCDNYGRQLSLYIEPGKFLTSEAGIFLVQVNTLKKNKERNIAGVNSGFTHLMRPVLYNAYHHIINISNPDGELRVYDICGNICESGDCFAVDRLIPEIREGDFLAIMNAGAYCFSMASIYNMRPLPREIFFIKVNLNLAI
ncbi:MAG: diaminopimelate decarboxylase [Spirochaetes bacterium]|nr:diaminopimelate decarboxylase [Spirochaetota bacterium]